MFRRNRMLLALVFSCSLVPLSRAQDDDGVNSHARIVRLSYIEGSVQLASDRGVENATMNVPLTEGNRISTSSNGWAEVQLEDGSTLRLAPSTQLTFSELGRDSSGDTLTTVDLDEGEAEFNVSRQHDSRFAVTVRNKTVLLQHSGRFRVLSTNQSPLEIAVLKGEVQVKDSDSGSEVSVKKDETLTFDPNDVSHYALDSGTQPDELDEWSRQRDQSLGAYASAGNGNYVQSPYQYGLSDLSYYGRYSNVPGYGYMWQPYGAGLGWDPFMNGYWVNSPFGPCWVSAYPWGWMPYRYGNWVFVNGLGWMWQPGGWRGWWRQPRLVNSPPGFHPPAPPARVGTITRTAGGPTGIPPGQRPRRVFSNDDVERHDSGGREHGLTNPASGTGAVKADRKPAMIERHGGELTETPHTESLGEIRRGRGRTPTTEAPVSPSAPGAPAASRPVIHAQPAPAVVPSRPAPPATSHPAPPAPRSFTPPAQHTEGGSMSRSAGTTHPGRPK